MKSLSLILRWSWRDLRANWAKVISIALVIAIGTGAYAGLTSNANWRRTSYNASYELLDMYDVRVELSTGSYAAQGELSAILATIDHASWVEASEERLIVPTQVDASTADEAILVRGEIIGSEFTAGGPDVNGYHAFVGRTLTEADSGEPSVMLERNFATFYELPEIGALDLSGGHSVDFVGQVTTPEYFAVSPEGEIFLSEANFAGVFTTLATAQQIAGAPGSVNDLVLTLTPEADRAVVVSELEAALAGSPYAAETSTRDDNASYTSLTQDVENDQQIFNVLAFLLFGGAVVAAYIMLHRLAQQQRREIGVAMALGVPRHQIAIRPLLVSAQIALLGVVLGIGVGMLLGNLMQSVLEEFVPLPIWETSFQTGVFAGVAVAGFLIPFLATAVPVIQAVRVKPIDAIRPQYHKAVPISRRSRKVHLHGTTFTRMPMHNLRRSPWRSAFTTLAVGLVIMVLVSFLGIMDSILGALDVAEEEAIGAVPDRVVVSLDSFYPAESADVAAVTEAESAAAADATLRIGGSLSSTADEFDVIIETLDLEAGLWHPTLVAGDIGAGGVVLAEEAADDLGVVVGDPVVLRHPQRNGPFTFGFVETELPVMALHPYPIRNFVYMDETGAELIGLAGVVNTVHVDPADGAPDGAIERELFAVPAVASAQTVASTTQAVEDMMGQMTGIIQTMAGVILLLAMLIAYLTSSISLDARVREHATMFAYGVKVRTALRMAITESAVMGTIATLIGVAGGVAILWWMTNELIATTLPDFGMEVILQPSTIITVIVLGVVAVALAPIFNVRRMRKMDLPGTLRLVE